MKRLRVSMCACGARSTRPDQRAMYPSPACHQRTRRDCSDRPLQRMHGLSGRSTERDRKKSSCALDRLAAVEHSFHLKARSIIRAYKNCVAAEGGVRDIPGVLLQRLMLCGQEDQPKAGFTIVRLW